MEKLDVALLQMVGSDNDLQINMRKGDAFCRKAKEMHADLALFPEMWSINYASCPTEPDARRAWQDQAVTQSDGWFEHFRLLAKELQMAIVITYLERWPGKPRNAAAILDRNGNVALTYAKIHTCDFGMEAALTPGDSFCVADLDTHLGPVKVGVMICHDREYPESARVLMLEGAELVLVPNACDLETNRIAQFRSRAYENMLAVAMTNYAAPKNNGHSIAFDGMAFREDGASRDTLVFEAGEEEGIHLARFDMADLRAYRGREVWGNAYRKPKAYGILVAEEVTEPFVRADARR